LSFAKRSRIVTVRVSQDEYQILDSVSRRWGANSVSEFLRQLIMNAEPVVSAKATGARDFGKDLEDLRRQVDRLSQTILPRASRKSGRDDAVGRKESQITAKSSQRL
jgi:hypothetical protein